MAPFHRFVNTEHERNTPQAFTHFTFEMSRGQLMVVDIQGISAGGGDLYTDPVSYAISLFTSKFRYPNYI
eukprot:SAG31_NODE_2198_length_6212_cov_3.843096_6_plen_70_part_00